MKKLCISLSVIVLLLSACATHTHTIGDGPQTGVTETARQYYVLFGLVPLNKVDTNAMIGDATDYRLDFDVKFIILSENKEVSYKESFKIKKNNQKFEQSNYEREIKRNFSEIVKDKLVLYLLNIDDN